MYNDIYPVTKKIFIVLFIRLVSAMIENNILISNLFLYQNNAINESVWTNFLFNTNKIKYFYY